MGLRQRGELWCFSNAVVELLPGYRATGWPDTRIWRRERRRNRRRGAAPRGQPKEPLTSGVRALLLVLIADVFVRRGRRARRSDCQVARSASTGSTAAARREGQ